MHVHVRNASSFLVALNYSYFPCCYDLMRAFLATLIFIYIGKLTK